MTKAMETPNDEIARLDMAARAEVAEGLIPSIRSLFVVLSLFFVVLASVDEGAFHETLFVRVIAFYTVVTTVILWRDWRYKLYLPALLFVAILVGSGWFPVDSGIRFFRVSDSFVRVYCLLKAYTLWQYAGFYATANAPGWEKEQAWVNGCLYMLRDQRRAREVIEFSTGSFWSGYFTFRLLNSGPYWAVAKFKRGNMRRLVEFRVRDLSAVTFTALPAGEMLVRIGNRTRRAVNVSPPGFGESRLPKSA
jgi:hypothetical protein